MGVVGSGRSCVVSGLPPTAVAVVVGLGAGWPRKMLRAAFRGAAGRNK
jgi:hypothetical protein